MDDNVQWQSVVLSRHPERPKTLDYVETLFEDFMELHGDRLYGDDPSIVAGLAKFQGNTLAFCGHQKGKNTEENVERRFGMPYPEGLRKALRIMKLAEKLSVPVVTFIDTPGAYPGIESEERGIARSIALNLMEMALLSVPTVSVIIGEGGSGGALALGVTDRILMLQNSTYSVITPEGCAAILWRSEEKKEEAARAMKLTAKDLHQFGIIDDIVPEPAGGAHVNPGPVFEAVAHALGKHLKELKDMNADSRLRKREDKYRKMGVYHGR